MLTVNQTFPKGMALAQWLAGPIVAASPTPGQITVSRPRSTRSRRLTRRPPSGSTCRNNPAVNMRSSQYLSFNTPVGTPEAMQCGKAVFTDIHIKTIASAAPGGDDSDPSKPFPMGCKTNNMSPQAKALEFLFFDLSSCLQPDTSIPVPPLVPPPGHADHAASDGGPPTGCAAASAASAPARRAVERFGTRLRVS